MRILAVVNWMTLGGIEVQLLRALPWLRRSGIDVDICRMAPGPLDAQCAAQGSTLWQIPKSANCYATAARFQRLLAAHDYHAVHCNLGYVSGGFALGAARAGVPIAVSIHSAAPTSLSGWRDKPLAGRLRAAWLGWHRRLMDRHADVLVGHSRVNLDNFQSDWREDPARYRVVLNGVEFPAAMEPKAAARRRLGLADDQLVLLHAGSFREEKNHAGLLQVFQHVLRQRPEAVLVLVGDGPLCGRIVRAVQEAGLTGRVRLAGPQRDVWPYYAAADVFVFPSTIEGFGNALVEAQGVGLPVVASDIPAHRESVAPVQRRFLFPLPDYELAAAMVLQQADTARRRANPWVPAAAEYVRKHFSSERLAADLATLYRDLVGNHPATSDRGTHSSLIPYPSSLIPYPSSLILHPSSFPPRLLHVTTIAATQWFLLRGQNQFMVRRGFELHAAASPGDYLARLEVRDGLTSHAVPISRRIAPLADAWSLVRLYALFRRLQPDVLHLSTPKAALLGALAAWAARVPIRLYHVRGLSSENERGWKRRVFALLERLSARLCHASVCNARSLLDYARREGILRAGEGKVLANGMANGIDPARFDPRRTLPADLGRFGLAADRTVARDRVVIGYVGRLTRDKGLEELAAAWGVLREEFPQSLLVLVGPHEPECPVSAEVQATLKADPRVILTGLQEETAAWYRAMDLAVFPSHGTEGFPNAPMEAAAMGLPVIVTRVVGSVDAVVDGVTGAVVPSKDAAALTAAMRRYLGDPDLRTRHGASGRRRVLADFRPEDIWEAWLGEYERLLRNARRPLPAGERVERSESRAAA